MKRVRIIGAGLAGSEAAWQCARRGIAIDLVEMRPIKMTPAHQTADFAELVCSNSLKSDSENTAPWLLKQEMRRAGSLLMEIARQTAVPAGHALAVDRAEFSRGVTKAIAEEPLIRVLHEEGTRIAEDEVTVIATGPLTSDALTAEIARLSATASAAGQGGEKCAGESQPGGSGEPDVVQGVFQDDEVLHGERRNFHYNDRHHNDQQDERSKDRAGKQQLFFYDSISPIVEAGSIDMNLVYLAARYDKGTADYINCPMSKEQYDVFYDALIAAQPVENKEWEKLNYFEGCLPIEEIARRGRDTLRFGPMKPVGLRDPRTGRIPYAVVQLRQENQRADSYNLVGFQNHLKFGEQARVLRLIPGLEDAHFLRYGQIHRNTYINSPALLEPTLQMRNHPQVLFAGQICGVEGYVESIATGVMAGMHASALVSGSSLLGQLIAPPRATAFGSLVHYITRSDARNFQPANITFDLLPALEKKVRDRKERHRLQCKIALEKFEEWLATACVQAAEK